MRKLDGEKRRNINHFVDNTASFVLQFELLLIVLYDFVKEGLLKTYLFDELSL